MMNRQPTLRRICTRWPGAEAVYLMGAFNNWSTTQTPMISAGEDRWMVSLPKDYRDAPLRLFVWEPGQRFGRVVPFENSAEVRPLL